MVFLYKIPICVGYKCFTFSKRIVFGLAPSMNAAGYKCELTKWKAPLSSIGYKFSMQFNCKVKEYAINNQ